MSEETKEKDPKIKEFIEASKDLLSRILNRIEKIDETTDAEDVFKTLKRLNEILWTLHTHITEARKPNSIFIDTSKRTYPGKKGLRFQISSGSDDWIFTIDIPHEIIKKIYKDKTITEKDREMITDFITSGKKIKTQLFPCQ